MGRIRRSMECTIVDRTDIVPETASSMFTPADSSRFVLSRVRQAVANLDAWLESVKQTTGYGGPVAHWWRHSLLYAGPGLDWRYEGILCGYASLYRKTGQALWLERINDAISHIEQGQLPDGGLQASEFEINPGTLGTPHEAAAVLGLLDCADCLSTGARQRVLSLAESILQNIIEKLWDHSTGGFNDRPGFVGRVPNKLATLAEALLRFYESTGERAYLGYARSSLDDVVNYQLTQGVYTGAVHQYAPGVGRGDGRLFPYYNARCVPGLLYGQRVLGEERYGDSAEHIARFIERSLDEDHWPQILYVTNGVARWPSWIAGTGDILRALRLQGRDVLGHPALGRLLDAQLSTGGFPTAEGFALRGSARKKPEKIDWLDVLPVCGWNDKVLRFLAEVLPAGDEVSKSDVFRTSMDVQFHRMPATYEEDESELVIRVQDRVVLRWSKKDPWVETQFRPPSL